MLTFGLLIVALLSNKHK
ncbi:hypothetical protein [Paenibacillus amylolyticus]